MTTRTAATAQSPLLWTNGDWNAFFGFGTNILVNMLVLTGLLRFVVKMPDSIVFGRILPALGLMLCLSTMYYAFLAYRLAQKTGRNDVCALPSGISVPHMFIVTFVIMLPIALKTNDPIKGWEAGLTWVFFQSFILMIGGFVAPIVRRITPRAALLGTLAGVSITFISMRPALEMYMTPVIGLTCFAVIMVSWFGGFRYPKGIPAGLVAIAVGMIIAWGSNLFGLDYGGLSLKGIGDAFTNFGFSVPLPAFDHVFSGFQYLGVILVTAIPFGIYDLVEAMDNVESAEAAGDAYPTTRVLTADGVVSLIGCLMGNPFINAVYIGHPGWKAMGGRIGYSGRDRYHGDHPVVVRRHLAVAGRHSCRGDLADPSLHRHVDRLAGIPGLAESARSGHCAVVVAASCRVVQDHDGWRIGGGRHQRRRDRHGQTRRGRCALSGPRGARRRLDPHRAGAWRHRRLRHRQEVPGSLGVRLRRRRAYLLRLHARGIRRHRRDADGCSRLPHCGGLLLAVEPGAGERAGPLGAA